MDSSGDKEFNELMQEVQQQFSWYQEKSSRRFQELEKLVELAAQQMEVLTVKRAQRKAKDKFINPFAKEQFGDIGKTEPLQFLKFKFPKYDEESGVTVWLQDCEHYFSIFKTGENHKATIAGMHLEGTPRLWFQMYSVGKDNLEWSEFCQQFGARFGDWEHEQDFGQAMDCASPEEGIKRMNQGRLYASNTMTEEPLKHGRLSNIPPATDKAEMSTSVTNLQGCEHPLNA